MVENIECSIVILDKIIELSHKYKRGISITRLTRNIQNFNIKEVKLSCYVLELSGLLDADHGDTPKNKRSQSTIRRINCITRIGLDYYEEINKTGVQKAIEFCKRHSITAIGNLIEQLPLLLAQNIIKE